MPLVFLFYLLCALTDCPPPAVHNNGNPNNPFVNYIKAITSFNSQPRSTISASSSSSSSDRFTRSNANYFKSTEPPVVISSLGAIQGRYMKSRSGRRIASFEGIPYALPPIGRLRFRDPVPVTSRWRGIFVANHTRKDCLQMDFSRLLQIRGEEDCLYLNVYCPDIFGQNGRRSKPLLPVIVFIHGGGWMSHSATPYGPRFLLDKEVVLVSFNFRLGILGFFSTGDHHAPGNFGMKDQVLALKWVKDNIKEFGGDPNRITLIGESTGAGSAALHILSPLTSKLVSIQGAIMLSGSSLNHWAVINDTFSNSKAIAKRMGCPTEKSAVLVNCLRQRNPYMVVGQQMQIWTIPLISRLLFGPVVESPVNNANAFLLEHPNESYSDKRRSTIKHIPVISGLNQDEGALFAANVYLVPFLFSAINNNWNKMAAYAMAYDRLPGIDMGETSAKISKFYFKGKRWSFNNRDEISNALGDRTISTGVYKFLESHSQVAPTYGYFFTYKSQSPLLNHVGLRGKEWSGVSHGDELPLIFSMDQQFYDAHDSKDLEMSKFLVDVFVNFAYSRQPLPNNIVSKNVTWSPILTPKYMRILEIGKEKKMISFPFMERMKFWKDLNLM